MNIEHLKEAVRVIREAGFKTKETDVLIALAEKVIGLNGKCPHCGKEL